VLDMTRAHIVRAAGFLAAAGAIAAAVITVVAQFTHGGHTTSRSEDGRLASAAATANVEAPSSPSAKEPGTITPAEAARAGLVPESVHLRGRFTAASGKPFGVYVGRDSDRGLECIILVGGGGIGEGCDRTMFTNGPVDFIGGASGGPARSKRTDFEIAGVVADSVARLDVVDSLGRVTRIDTSGASKAFFFEVKPQDLARGVGVNTLVARDASGALISSVDVSEPGP
jgi:hypothetical protein